MSIKATMKKNSAKNGHKAHKIMFLSSMVLLNKLLLDDLQFKSCVELCWRSSYIMHNLPLFLSNSTCASKDDEVVINIMAGY